MNQKWINIVFAWAVILIWGTMRGWQMSPPGYIALAAAAAATCWIIWGTLKK